MSSTEQDALQEQGNSLYVAIARTATRSAALYFSRPVRLFRPSKVNGWQTLKWLASHHGKSLTPQYLAWLVKQHGLMVIPKHFVPPMIVNGALGYVLWTTYSEVSDALETRISDPLALAAISGASAGGMQALVAAPAENVRLAVEGGSTSARGWSHAWKEVFRGTQPRSTTPTRNEVREARQVRDWMRDVTDMAGRGWEGWGWGCAKDMCGFAVFFSIFELTRRVAMKTKSASQAIIISLSPGDRSSLSLRKHGPRVVHATTLVAGGAVAGLAYELMCRPWDVARKAVHIDRLGSHGGRQSIAVILVRKLREDGLLSYFQDSTHVHHEILSISPLRRRLHSASRTLARYNVDF
ncbi:hypothetical protein WOLCODRAFT_130711, partial [Wolfiporia cocos MD-104 SS10]